jgi:hypothetical protein
VLNALAQVEVMLEKLKKWHLHQWKHEDDSS